MKPSRTPVILQLSETECGIASLAMVFSYYNFHISLEQLREQCGVSRDGCKAKTLLNVARNHGFHADAYRVDIEGLDEFSLPLIAYWNFNHYVVIKKITPHCVFVNDPAHGAITVSMQDFDRSFTGVVLDISPSLQARKVKSNQSLSGFFGQWFAGFSQSLLFLLLCILAMSVIPYFYSILSSLFIDQGLVANNRNWVPVIMALTMLFASLSVFLTLRYQWVQFRVYSKAGIKKSADILHAILNLPMLFFALRQSSEIVSVLARAESAINLLFKSALALTSGILISVLSLFCMMLLDIRLSCISVVITFISGIIFYWFAQKNLSHEKSHTNMYGKHYAHAISSIRNLETIKASGLEGYALKKWNKLFNYKLNIQARQYTLDAIMQAFNRGCIAVATLALLCEGGSEVTKGVISIGQLMGYYSLHLIFYQGVSSWLQTLRDFQRVYVLNSRLDDIASTVPDPRFLSKNSEIKTIKKEHDIISLSDVSFYYNANESPVLKNIVLNVKRGEHVALVGATGSGKSSLLKLISGFYQPSAGDVYCNGISLLHHSAASLAKSCAYVSQNTALFSGTLLQNLVFSNESASQCMVNTAIQQACLEEVVQQRTLHGKVEESGCNFSGGERQRIDLARALIQDAPILILDEATSALDIETEAEIIKNLRDTKKTIIFTAHRLSTVKHCDKIIVLHQGQVVECGSHLSLLNQRGYYYDLIRHENTKSRFLLCQ